MTSPQQVGFAGPCSDYRTKFRVRTLHRYHIRPADACNPTRVTFFAFVVYLPSPASSPPPHLHRRVSKVLGVLRGECNTIQSVAEYLPALPRNTSDISVLPAQDNSSVYVHCTNIARAPLILVAQPTAHARCLRVLQFPAWFDNGTEHASPQGPTSHRTSSRKGFVYPGPSSASYTLLY